MLAVSRSLTRAGRMIGAAAGLLLLASPLSHAERLSVASVGPGGVQVQSMDFPSVSADGRFVAFLSYEDGLDPADTNNIGDVYIYDDEAGFARMSRIQSAVWPFQFINTPRIAPGGRHYVFSGTNSVTPFYEQLYMTDLDTAVTKPISRAPNGDPANQSCYVVDISPDGRFVLFSSSASNLVAGDTNSRTDLFLYDHVNASIERVSVGNFGSSMLESNGDSFRGAVSDDGRYVVFVSSATNIGLLMNNGLSNVYLRDRTIPSTRAISYGLMSGQVVPPDGAALSADISGDGSTVVFTSQATNMRAPSRLLQHETELYAYSVATDTLSVTGPAQFEGRTWRGGGFDLQVSQDGSRIAYSGGYSLGSDYIFGTFRFDSNSQSTVITTRGFDGALGAAFRLGFSADGSTVVYVSDSLLAPEDMNNCPGCDGVDVYRFGPCAAPQITVSPAPEEEPLGGRTFFAIETSTRTSPTFIWTRNGMLLLDGGNISGAGGPVLRINPVTSTDYGAYVVTVIDACGTTNSLPVMLTPGSAGSCRGDANADQAVNFTDIVEVLRAWGVCAP